MKIERENIDYVLKNRVGHIFVNFTKTRKGGTHEVDRSAGCPTLFYTIALCF